MLKIDLEKDTNLDRFKLEIEAARNADLLDTYSDLARETGIAYDQARAAARRVRAAVELKIRRTPPKEYALDKYSEAVITALIEDDKDVQVVEEEVLRCKYENAKYADKVIALQDKSRQLKILSSLWIGGYYSENGVYQGSPKGEDD